MPPPMAVQSKNRGGPMSVHGHLWWPAVAKLQAASVPIGAYSLGSCAMGQTDERIALFQNAPRGKI